jgi:hypothetical protein
VRTSVAGFDPFYGTSAAAPHAAAIAALVISGNPGLPPADVRAALINTAVDIEAPAVDNVSGAGVLADRVLAYTGASPQPLAVAQQPTVAADDGGAFLDPGDTATVPLPVTNNGDGTAVSTSVVLTSPTPGGDHRAALEVLRHDQPRADRGEYLHPHGADHAGARRSVVLSAKVTFAGSLSPTTAHLAEHQPARPADRGRGGRHVDLPGGRRGK